MALTRYVQIYINIHNIKPQYIIVQRGDTMDSLTVTIIHVIQILLATIGMWQLVNGGIFLGLIIVLLVIASDNYVPYEKME